MKAWRFFLVVAICIVDHHVHFILVAGDEGGSLPVLPPDDSSLESSSPSAVVAESVEDSGDNNTKPDDAAGSGVASRYINWLDEENGIKVLINEDSVQQALEEGAVVVDLDGSEQHQPHNIDPHQPQLMLTLIYSSSCPHSLESLSKMESAIPLLDAYMNDPIRRHHQSLLPLPPHQRPLFGKLDGNHIHLEDRVLLDRMGIVAFPTLLFVTNVVEFDHNNHNTNSNVHDGDVVEQAHENNEQTMKILFLDYMGLHSTPQDIANTVLLFYYRMVMTPRHFHNHILHVLPIPFASLSQVEAFLQIHGPGFLRPTRSLNLSPELSQSERDYITWLLQEEEEFDDENQDALVVFVQCRDAASDDIIADPNNGNLDANHPTAMMLFSMFDEMSGILSSRPDRAFFTVENCSPEHQRSGDVTAYRIPPSLIGTRLDGSGPGIDTNHNSNNNDDHDDSKDKSSDSPSFGAALDWNQYPHVSFMSARTSSSSSSSVAADLKLFLTQQATPSVLWFDRQSTAPIVFHKSRKVHAVLFVDLHRHYLHSSDSEEDDDDGSNQQQHDQPHNTTSNMDLRQQEIVREFRKVCRYHQDYHYQAMDDDMPCLIVPSTETRILTTFGIDIWSHWDDKIAQDVQRFRRQQSSAPKTTTKQSTTPTTEPSEHMEQVLPILLITDQRIPGTTLRYYLDPTEIFSKSTSMLEFVQAFWAGRLKPELQSSSLPKNHNATSGTSVSSKGSKRRKKRQSLTVLTGRTFENELLHKRRHQHRLVLFFTPSCGHCKRFLLVWKQLAGLLQYIEWDSFLTLYKMDVTENEFAYPADWNMSLYWLPDLYYFPPSVSNNNTTDDTEEEEEDDSRRVLHERPIRYDREDTRGDGVGRLSHPLEIVDWLLDVGNFDESALLKLLDTDDAFNDAEQDENSEDTSQNVIEDKVLNNEIP